MSGKTRRMTINGDEYDVPEGSYENVVRDLSSRGIPFGPPADASIPDGQKPELGGPPAPAQPDPIGALADAARAGEAPEPYQPPAYPMTSPDAPSATSTVGAAPEPQVTPKAAAGGSGGDWVDALLDPVTNGLQKVSSYAGSLGAGMLHGATLGASRHIPVMSDMDQQAQYNPRTAMVGDAVGGMLTPAKVPGGGFVVDGIVNPALQGFARGYADNYDGDSSRAVDAGVHQGLDNALFSGATSGAAKLAGAGVSALGNTLGKAADKARAAGWGVPTGFFEERAAAAHVPVDQYARDFIRHGEDVVGTNHFLPMSAGDVQRNAKAATGRLNSDIGQTIDEARAAGATLPSDVRGQVVRDLDLAADRSYYGGSRDGQKLASALSDEAGAIEVGPQFHDPHDVRSQKSVFDRVTYKGTPAGTPESYASKASEEAGHSYRGILRDYVRQGGPELEQRFTQANRDYGLAADIRDLAAARADRQWVKGGPLGTAASSLAGAGVGYMLGGASGALGGAAAGYGARKAFEGAAPDFGANLGRMAESAAVPTGRFLSNADIGRGLGAVRNASAEANRAHAAHEGASARDESRGHQLDDAIVRQLERDPSVFGSHARDFIRAENATEREALAEKLAKQDTDIAQLLERLRSY